MKRKFAIFTAIIVVIVCLASLVACTKDEQNENENFISRQTDTYYAGENAQFAVSVEVGKREKNFVADGKCVDVEDFVQIEIVPLVKNEYESINYVLSGEDATYSGELVVSSNGEWTAVIDVAFAPSSVSITAGVDSAEITLSNVLDGCLSAQEVQNIAKDAFKERIDKETALGKGDREVYIKLISGDRKTYYYYVSFIGEGVDYWAMLVNPQSGEIVTKK